MAAEKEQQQKQQKTRGGELIMSKPATTMANKTSEVILFLSLLSPGTFSVHYITGHFLVSKILFPTIFQDIFASSSKSAGLSMTVPSELPFDPFDSLAIKNTQMQINFDTPSYAPLTSSSFGLPKQQQQHISQQNQLDLLAEFLPPPSSSRPSSASPSIAPFIPASLQPKQQQQQTMNQSASFAAFPSIPLPTASGNPIHRKTTATTSGTSSFSTIDPFDSILPKPSTGNNELNAVTGANLFSQFTKDGDKDPFKDLLK